MGTDPIRPLSRAFEERYAAEMAQSSRRRLATAAYLNRVRTRRFLNHIEIVTIA